MFDGNISTLASMLLGACSVAVLVFYLLPKQFAEVLRPKDWLTALRWQILVLLGFITLMALPSLVYLTLRYMGLEYETMRSIASITNRLSFAGAVLVLVLVFNYKRRD